MESVPKVSEEHLEARRRRILAGAQRAFSKYGYDGATVARLEEETGLSRGAIFHYYHGKKDLFIALSVDVNTRFVELLVDKGLDEAIRSIAYVDPELIGVLLEVQGRLRHDEEFQQRMNQPSSERDRLVEWFAARQADGTFRDDVGLMDLGRFATMVVNGIALRVAAGDPFDVEVTIELLHDALGPRK